MLTDNELSYAVARARGWEYIDISRDGLGPWWAWHDPTTGKRHESYTPAADIAQAWELIGDRMPLIAKSDEGHWRVYLDQYSGAADTAPRAICLAYLASKGYDTDEKIRELVNSKESV